MAEADLRWRRPLTPGGPEVARIGQGTWRMGERPAARAQEVAALRLGIDLGLTHIDTAEMYAAGRAEEIVGEAIAGRRDAVFVATKVMPQNASRRGTIAACERSLRRLGTDWIDLCLLHWWDGRYPIEETMEAMQRLVDAGKVRYAGVSNLDVDELERARSGLDPTPLVCNQVLYHLGERGIEHRLLPYCAAHRIGVVAYSPFGQGRFPGPGSAGGRLLAEIGAKYGRTPRQIALNFL
ncbi:MAG TPA: aldo/keto reductase, partial [Limnochordia bacterium]